MLIDGLGRTEAEKFQAVQQHFKPLWLDEVPAMIPGCEPAEAPEPPHHHGDVDPQGAGVILDKYKNCEFHEWTGADGGVYVGKGAGALTCSISQENYQDSLEPQLVGQALDGRRLYLLKDELQLGRDLVDRFGIEGHGDIWSTTTSEKFLRHFVKGKVTVSFCGVVLKMVLRARPGHLGTFARSLPCCTRKHFRQSPIDLLPIRLPQDTLEEKALMKKLNGMFTRNEPPPADLQPLLEEAQVCGESAWLWI